MITPGRSTNKCRINKNENKNEMVMSVRSQQNIIQRGAYLFLKNRSSIKDFWGQIFKINSVSQTDKGYKTKI